MPEEKKIYLNIQEQVEKNKKDIQAVFQGATVLAEFGIKVIGQVDEESELPDPADYLEAGGEYGDAYIVGTEAPFEYYIFTRAFEGQEEPSWFDLGIFPQPGPQGQAGQDGATGPAGKGIVSIEKVSTSGLNDTYQITYTDGSFTTYVVKNGADGEAAAIAGATASVDNGVGTPTVDLTVGGTNTSRTFSFAFHNLRGAQGVQGEPGAFFIIAGQVATASLLPDASDVSANKAYLVGGAAPYDVYCIMVVNDVHYWLNLGPVLVQVSDTKVGALTFSASGTLSAEVLAEIVNTETADFLKIGDRYFVKQSTGHYYALKRDSGQMLLYALDVDLSTGEWIITTETMVDLDSAQAITGVKKFDEIDVKISADGTTKVGKIVNVGNYHLGIKINDDNMLLFDGTSNAVNATNFLPLNNNSRDLGNSLTKWRDIYFAGSLKDGTKSFSLVDIYNKTINFIDASDISSSTLTADQLALFGENKIAILINGPASGLTAYQTLVFMPGYDNGTYIRGHAFGEDNAGSTYWLRYEIQKSSRQITVKTIVYTSTGGRAVIPDASSITVTDLDATNFRNRSIPTLPSDNLTKLLLGVGPNGGDFQLYRATNDWEDGGFIHVSADGHTFSLSSQKPTGAKSVDLYIAYQNSQAQPNGDTLIPLGNFDLEMFNDSPMAPTYIVSPANVEGDKFIIAMISNLTGSIYVNDYATYNTDSNIIIIYRFHCSSE